MLNVKYKKWATQHGFALTLNDLSEGVATYGTIVWKVVEGKDGKYIEECDFNNLYYDPLVKNINDSNIIEKHELTRAEIQAHYPKINWNEFKHRAEQVGADRKQLSDKWIVWEFTGYEKEANKFVHKIVAGAGDDEMTLFSEPFDPEKPRYFDFHVHRYKGRHLRIGIYERLFSLQERINELVNQNAETTAISSLLLLRTTDPNTRGNVLQGAISGQIITSSDLEQVPMDNRNLSSFLQEMALIEAQATKLCLTPEVISGESLPSHTPFRSMAALTNAAKSAFKNTRDRLGVTITKILMDYILPDQVKKWNRGEIIEIMDNTEDINYFDQVTINHRLNQWLEQKFANNQTVLPEEQEQFKQSILKDMETGGRKLKIEKGFFNFEFGFTMNPTGENADRDQQNDVYFNALQFAMNAPYIVEHPLYRQYLEINGIPPFKMTKEQLMQQQENVSNFQPTSGKKDSLMSKIDTTQ